MSSKQRRGGAEKGKDGADRRMIETIQEATGATEDDIRVMLEECNFDANETTSRLIDNPFSQVQSRKEKKKKRDEDKKKEPASKVMEIRRNSSSGGRGRGQDRERGQRGDRGSERSNDRGARNQPSFQPPVPSASPEKQPQGVEEVSSVGNWELVGSQDLEPQLDRPVHSGVWGEVGSKAPSQTPAHPPIGTPTSLPALIRPPGVQAGAKKSMADLFKRPTETASTGSQPPMSSNQNQQSASASTAPSPDSNTYAPPQESGEANGWGSTHATDMDSSRQSSSLGGIAIEAPKKTGGSQQQPIQAGNSSASTSASLFPNQIPVGSLGNPPASSPRLKIEESASANAWGASSGPSTTGLGGVPVEAPPRQHSQLEQPQHPQYPASDMPSATSTAWAPKTTPSNSGAPSLGGSILNSIQPQSFASAHSGANDILPAASPPAAQQHTLGNSHSTFGHSPMVIPSPNQQGSNDLNSTTIQFGGFSLGNSGQDLGTFSSSAYPSAFEVNSSQAELPASLGPSASEPFKPSYSALPSTSLAQTQQQRAYNAFTSAAQPQAQGSFTTSHPLYSQGYQNYGTGGQSFNQYQPAAQPTAQQQAYQNYNSYQAPTEAEQTLVASSASQASAQPTPAVPMKSSLPYDPSQSAYTQYSSHHGAAAKDFQPAAPKYSSASHLPAAPAVSGHNLAQVVNQTPLQVPSGYGFGQASGVQQAYGGYGAQQGYNSNSYQQYSNYANTGYGGYNRNANPYQPQQGAVYGQGMKGYGGTGYSAGGGYHNAGAAYGAAAHKPEKEHQVSHMGGSHNLYGQQQLPLSSQSHFQGGLTSSNQGYGNYSNATQGYSNYGMGGSRQYPNQY